MKENVIFRDVINISDSWLVLDIDGTLLNSDGILENKTIENINNIVKAGKKVTIATGRSVQECFKIIKPLNINLPIICLNGQVIYDIKKQRPLSQVVLNKTISTLIEPVLNQVYISIDNGEYITSNSKILALIMSMYFGIRRESIIISEALNFDSAIKIYLCMRNSVQKTEDLYYKINSIHEDFEVSNYFNRVITIKSAKCNKAHALKNLCVIYNQDIRNTIFIGDGINDLDIMQTVGCGIALRNSVIEIKKYATIIIEENYSDGLNLLLSDYLRYNQTSQI